VKKKGGRGGRGKGNFRQQKRQVRKKNRRGPLISERDGFETQKQGSDSPSTGGLREKRKKQKGEGRTGLT